MVTKGYGLTVHDIDMSCPADLEPYAKAYKLEQDNMDALMWAWWGNYGFSATLTAVERCPERSLRRNTLINQYHKERKKIKNLQKMKL